MSRLPNAPLLEVIFELRWAVTNQDDLKKYQYLSGDLYSLLKKSYPIREPLASPEFPVDFLIGNPVHRFRREQNNYPLFQVGPGVVTLNTTDANYDWDEYAEWANELVNAFFQVYPVGKSERFTPILSYYDFFKMSNTEVLDFVNTQLSIKIHPEFYPTDSKPTGLNFGITYDTHIGKLSVTVNEGKNALKEDGLVTRIRLQQEPIEANSQLILNWLYEAHVICSNVFKELTKGNLYESFH